MTNPDFSISTFIQELENIWNGEGRDLFVLNIDDSKTWPHFTISGKREGTPIVKGHFVEGGTSYWQISDSGRERFTGNDHSCVEFINEMKATIHVLVTTGCTETRWTDQGGNLVNSTIVMEVSGKEIIFGDPPAFWRRGLIEESITYAPYRSISS